MAKQLIGFYENPKPEDAERIAKEAKAYADVVEAQEKGWIMIGTIGKDTTEEELEELDRKTCEVIVRSMAEKARRKKQAGELDEPVS